MPTRDRGEPGHSPGFALIVVLWTLVLIAFITAEVAGTSRIELRIAGNLSANAAVAAAADGGVSRAIFALFAPDPARRWPSHATRELTIGNCRVTVRVSDEAGRINPNLAPSPLLESLLRVTGSDPATARRLAASIGAWAGLADAARTQNALVAEYRDAGRDYAPPGAPLESLGELRRVLGMTPAVFAAIRPHLSLFAPAAPAAAEADPAVQAALAALPQQHGAAPLPPVARRSAAVTMRIEASARGPGNARAERTAVVRIDAQNGVYTILAWRSDNG